jgi:hypothetical protein
MTAFSAPRLDTTDLEDNVKAVSKRYSSLLDFSSAQHNDLFEGS